uniref:IS91 family transposase n=1 Tax=Desulfogranum mediterraneum TaxID=160661 RepID=UPI0012947842|nr:transposase [Desulfogranum mediterraneum]
MVLKDFGLNPKHLGAEIGMTMVLHTNIRRMEYHPHIHVVIPGGDIDRRNRYWKKLKGKYHSNERALAKVFRARFLSVIQAAGLVNPKKASGEWVAHCVNVERGGEALKYLSRYLYRGVLSEQNIVSSHDEQVRFKYVESESGETKFRILPGEEFLHLMMQHVLPKGFRRVRGYGLLHGNAKRLRSLIQLILHVITEQFAPRPRPVFKCPCCKDPMLIVAFRRNISRPG